MHENQQIFKQYFKISDDQEVAAPPHTGRQNQKGVLPIQRRDLDIEAIEGLDHDREVLADHTDLDQSRT